MNFRKDSLIAEIRQKGLTEARLNRLFARNLVAKSIGQSGDLHAVYPSLERLCNYLIELMDEPTVKKITGAILFQHNIGRRDCKPYTLVREISELLEMHHQTFYRYLCTNNLISQQSEEQH
jgi:hypothetical protein